MYSKVLLATLLSPVLNSYCPPRRIKRWGIKRREERRREKKRTKGEKRKEKGGSGNTSIVRYLSIRKGSNSTFLTPLICDLV